MVKKVLVVDDNPDVIFSVKSGFETLDKNYMVKGVDSGKKCLEFLQNEIPDIILMDIMMPEMSGWKTFDKIKENVAWQDIPIIFLTARTAGGFLGEDYIEKPFEIKDLVARINKVLKN